MATRKPKAVETETAPETVKKPRAAKAADAAGKPAVTRAKKPKSDAAARPVLTPEERYRQIAEAAYYIAEKRNFAPGNHNDDWLTAEAEVDGKTAA